ncbi:hypothetical protein BJ684DRAFT_21969 [Piptocephalis cylindrospora]|uniref:UBC core domain-containing protein n=1 Tax=Piptocephalis cylindrospora TaxID=1907219 RepID=A0A4V1IXL3_9FUNG|nr:hypothetical protein BJ684DRAFT_21969 [Piptocephalis cylindrospora]|eukprot:RKP11459.1 hypothetical protein BJ684DRAFT_21969 [Piptocephalis cylindrospora]
MFDMINIFEVFLPQLLRYPNASDPLNGDAASLFIRDKEAYEAKAREYVKLYGTPEAMAAGEEDESSEEDEMSSVESFSDSDEAANMDL